MTTEASAASPANPSRFYRPWMRYWLVAAAIYNIVWGAFVVFFPNAMFAWAGAELPRYPQLWQCVGMIVGVYGVGYACAAIDPLRHWPIVLVGLLGKIFGPIGFVGAVASGAFPAAFGWTILTNDLVWLVPFTLILWAAFKHNVSGDDAGPTLPVGEALDRFTLPDGRTLRQASDDAPVLLMLLRHAGCTFCVDAMHDLARERDAVKQAGAIAVVAHPGSGGDLRAVAEKLELGDLPIIDDGDRVLYRAFELPQGSFWQLMGPAAWWRGAKAVFLRGAWPGKLDGDGLQMPGTFVVHRGEVVAAHRNENSADNPDLAKLLREAGAMELSTTV